MIYHNFYIIIVFSRITSNSFSLSNRQFYLPLASFFISKSMAHLFKWSFLNVLVAFIFVSLNFINYSKRIKRLSKRNGSFSEFLMLGIILKTTDAPNPTALVSSLSPLRFPSYTSLWKQCRSCFHNLWNYIHIKWMMVDRRAKKEVPIFIFASLMSLLPMIPKWGSVVICLLLKYPNI